MLAPADKTRVAVFGAGGYSGTLLCRLLARHPAMEVVLLGSERLAQERSACADWGLRHDIQVLPEAGAAAACADLKVQVALLATPAETSLSLAAQLLGPARVLDLSGAFRLREGVYALPEVTGTAALRDARLVANPGCYATAALLALAPLVRADLLLPGAPIFIDGKSGATGAGRKADVALSLAELFGELRPYRIGHHQHEPEIAAVLQRPVHFVPHLCGVARGLLVTCHAQLRPGVDQGPVREALQHRYAACPRIHVVPADQVSLRRPVGTPDAWVGAQATGDAVCAVASLDNLLKGAASQAVQNLNGMLGLPEAMGLESLWSI